MPLIIGPRDARAIREETGFDVTGHPDFIVHAGPPARWPPGQPWPPQVTVPGKPCWRCVARPRPENPLERYFAEHPIGEFDFRD